MPCEQRSWTAHSKLVQHWMVQNANHMPVNHTNFLFRQHLMCLALVLIGLVGFFGTVAAGPIIVENEDSGGSGGVGLTTNQQVAARLFDEVFVQQQPGVCALLMTSSAVTHTPAGDFEGPDGFERYVAELWITYPNATFAVDEGVADGNLMTFRWSINGEQAIHLEGLTILRFEQSMITESWFDYDSAASTEQGMVTPGIPEICPPCREP